ncbi:hypothetical protein PFISCL1PPCAC_19228, partial [Pristionchus fissidentatus]
QCTSSTSAAHCSRQLCDIKERDGKVPACVFVRDGPSQHYACIRVEEEKEMGCSVMKGRHGHKVACLCRDVDMCNVDLAERVDGGGDQRREFKVPAELLSEPSEPWVESVRVKQSREEKKYDVLLTPDRDDSLGVAPSVVDFFDEEGEEEGRRRGGQRDRDFWSEEDEKVRWSYGRMEKHRGSPSYRPVHGVDNRELVPLSVVRLGEGKRTKLDENIIDLTNSWPSLPPPPLYPPYPLFPYHPSSPSPTTTSTLPPPPPPPSRPPTPFTIGRINTFLDRPSSDPVPYPKQRWDDLPPVPNPTTTTTTTTTTEPPTTTTRRPPTVSWSRYVVSTTTTTVAPTTTTTTVPSTTITTVPSTTTTTTVPPTTTTTTETP